MGDRGLSAGQRGGARGSSESTEERRKESRDVQSLLGRTQALGRVSTVVGASGMCWTLGQYCAPSEDPPFFPPPKDTCLGKNKNEGLVILTLRHGVLTAP